MRFNKYFQEELSYLRLLGQEFSRANPGLVQFLGRDSTDPEVQRLTEAFAFLAGRLREKIDDEMPELSHSLFEVLYPHYLHPIPPFSVLSFAPIPGALVDAREVPVGAMVETASIDGTRCRFQTRYPVTVRPLRVAGVKSETAGTGSAFSLRIEAVGDDVTIGGLRLESLRLYLRSGSVPGPSRWLFLFMTRYLERITVRNPSSGETLGSLPPSAVKPVGLDGTDTVLPFPPNVFPGFKLVQEYFAVPARFMFLDVADLHTLVGNAGNALELIFDFDRQLPADIRIEPDIVQLNATPIINLFPQDGEPITIDHSKTEYRVRASARHPDHYDVATIERVTGWVQGRGARVEYPKFETFSQTVAGDLRSPEAPIGGTYVRTRRRPAVVGNRVDTFLAFVHRTDVPAIPPTEVASLSLQCTNGPLVDRIAIGAINQPTGDTPPEVTFRNVEVVSDHIPAPVRGDILWRLVSNLAVSQSSIVDKEVLIAALGAYDFGALVDERRRERLALLLTSFRRVRSAPINVLVRGAPVRGAQILVEIDESGFGGAAEAYLLGSMLDQFFAAYASINSCHKLALRCTASNTTFEWPLRSGQAVLL